MSNPIYRTPPFFVNEIFATAEQLGEQIDWGAKLIGLPDAWLKTAGEGVTVAVLDTGIDRQHVESGDLTNVAEEDILSAVPRTDGYCVRNDYHGAHCAGIIAANANDMGVRGAAYKCRLLSIKCMHNGSGQSDWIGRSLDMARERGAELDVMAPGSNVLSTWSNGGYSRLSGTSMATPMVAAVTALLVSRHRGVENPTTPMETMQQLRTHLQRGCVDMGESGHDSRTGFGLIDASKLVEDEPDVPTNPPQPLPPGDESPIIELGPIKIYMPARAGDLVSASATLKF